jgi:hypothetical protein
VASNDMKPVGVSPAKPNSFLASVVAGVGAPLVRAANAFSIQPPVQIIDSWNRLKDDVHDAYKWDQPVRRAPDMGGVRLTPADPTDTPDRTRRLQAVDQLGGDVLDLPASVVRQFVNTPFAKATGIDQSVPEALELTGLMAAPGLGRAAEGIHPPPNAFVSAGKAAPAIEGQGVGGPRIAGLQGNWPGAVAALRQLQGGEAPGALYHPAVGPIDVVWGDENGGLAHILAKHPDMVDKLPEALSKMEVTQSSPNRVRLESPDHHAVVRLDYDGQAKKWLLTAFEKEK